MILLTQSQILHVVFLPTLEQELKHLGILVNHVKQKRPHTHRGKKGGIRRMKNLTYVSLTYNNLMTLHLYMTLLYEHIHNESILNFCVLNMQSILNKCDEFSDYVLQIDLHDIAITLTLLKPGDDLIIRECTPPGYIFSSCSKDEWKVWWCSSTSNRVYLLTSKTITMTT